MTKPSGALERGVSETGWEQAGHGVFLTGTEQTRLGRTAMAKSIIDFVSYYPSGTWKVMWTFSCLCGFDGCLELLSRASAAPYGLPEPALV